MDCRGQPCKIKRSPGHREWKNAILENAFYFAPHFQSSITFLPSDTRAFPSDIYLFFDSDSPIHFHSPLPLHPSIQGARWVRGLIRGDNGATVVFRDQAQLLCPMQYIAWRMKDEMAKMFAFPRVNGIVRWTFPFIKSLIPRGDRFDELWRKKEI